MSKFYILEEYELFDPNDMSEFAVEFDGDLREFVKEKIKNDKKIQYLMNELAATPTAGALLTPDEVRNVLGKRALIHPTDDAREELNIVHCPDCKYCVKTKDGEYNPDDIVCSYWCSDGLESKDFCSYGEKGEYEWYDQEDHQVYGIWRSAGPLVDSMECSECGYQVCVKDLCTPFCPWCGVKMVNFKELEEEKWKNL